MLRLLKRKPVDPQAKLREILGGYELPSFPAVVMDVLKSLREPGVSMAAVGDVVASDPGLTVRVLRAVNCSAFALRHEVKNVHHAVSLLGPGELESMLISMAVGQSLPRQSTRGYEARRFWRASARRAATAASLADVYAPATRSVTLTAALLQDLAIPILAHAESGGYGSLLEHSHSSGDELVELERAEFGWDHAEVGAWICQAWTLPGTLRSVIGRHHAVPQRDPASLPAVNLVSSLTEARPEIGLARFVRETRDFLGIPEDEVHDLVNSSFADAEEIAALLG